MKVFTSVLAVAACAFVAVDAKAAAPKAALAALPQQVHELSALAKANPTAANTMTASLGANPMMMLLALLGDINNFHDSVQALGGPAAFEKNIDTVLKVLLDDTLGKKMVYGNLTAVANATVYMAYDPLYNFVQTTLKIVGKALSADDGMLLGDLVKMFGDIKNITKVMKEIHSLNSTHGALIQTTHDLAASAEDLMGASKSNFMCKLLPLLEKVKGVLDRLAKGNLKKTVDDTIAFLNTTDAVLQTGFPPIHKILVKIMGALQGFEKYGPALIAALTPVTDLAVTFLEGQCNSGRSLSAQLVAGGLDSIENIIVKVFNVLTLILEAAGFLLAQLGQNWVDELKTTLGDMVDLIAPEKAVGLYKQIVTYIGDMLLISMRVLEPLGEIVGIVGTEMVPELFETFPYLGEIIGGLIAAFKALKA